MIEIPSDVQSHDINQWLDGGVFLARRNDEWTECTFGGAHDDGRIICYFLDGDSATKERSDVRAHWPTCGSINMPKFALYVQRLQRRQWRRTFNARCISLSIPGKWQHLKQIEARELRVAADNPEFLRAVFNPTYPSNYDEAMQMLNDRPSVALSPQILLVGSPNPQVYYRGKLVGQMIGGRYNAECDPLTERRVSKLMGVLV